MDTPRYPSGIYKRGNGLEIRIWQKGKLAYQETIPCNPTSKADIRRITKYREQLKVKIDLGIFFVEENAPNHLQPFSIMAQEYIKTFDGKHSTTIGYLSILNNHWMPLFRLHPCASITLRQIKNFLADLKHPDTGEPITKKTRDNILGPLRGVLDYAEVSPNPARLIKTKKAQTKPKERYTPSERDKILNCFSGDIYVYFALFYGCGLRPGELKGLLRADYDGEHWQIHQQIVRRRLVNSTKTAHRRKVYVPDWVKAAIKTMPPRIDSPYFFVNENGGFFKDTRKFNRAWKKAHKRKQIRIRDPYTCRHTRAAELLSMGLMPAECAVQMGHSTTVFLNTYSEFIDEYAPNKDPRRFESIPEITHKHEPS